MQQHTATDTFNDQQLFFQILVLERQLYCWVGTAQARMSTLTLAMPTPLVRWTTRRMGVHFWAGDILLANLCTACST